MNYIFVIKYIRINLAYNYITMILINDSTLYTYNYY